MALLGKIIFRHLDSRHFPLILSLGKTVTLYKIRFLLFDVTYVRVKDTKAKSFHMEIVCLDFRDHRTTIFDIMGLRLLFLCVDPLDSLQMICKKASFSFCGSWSPLNLPNTTRQSNSNRSSKSKGYFANANTNTITWQQ